MSTPAVTPMLSPDGEVRNIPNDQVQAAVQAGGKTVSRMMDPQGIHRWVPDEAQQDAIRNGGIPLTPNGMPKMQPPQVNMQQDQWGIQDNPNQAGAGLPGMTGNRPVTNADLVPGAIAGGAAATVAAPAVIGSLVAGSPVLKALAKWGLGASQVGAGVAAEEELRKYIKKQLGATK